MAEILQERGESSGKRDQIGDYARVGQAADPHTGLGLAEREEGDGTKDSVQIDLGKDRQKD